MKNYSGITIKELELAVHLGWPESERLHNQVVLLDLTIHFNEATHACLTDNLEDTFCYDVLIQKIKEFVSSRDFRLLEHLGHEIHHFIKQLLPNINLTTSIMKKPHIPGLTGGVVFYYGDG